MILKKLKFRRYNGFWPMLLPFVFFNILTLLSLVIFENYGHYADEIDIYGYHNGSIEAYLYYLLIAFASILFVWRGLLSKITHTMPLFRCRKELIVLSLLLLLFYATPLLIHGPAFIKGVNRYEYQLLPYVKFFNLKLMLAIFSFVWGAYASRETKFMNPFILLYAGYLLVCILYGEKASGPINSVFFFYTGYLIYSYKRPSIKKILTYSLGTLIFIFTFFYIQLYLIDINPGEILEAFLSRFSRQGQIFFGVIELDLQRQNMGAINWDLFNYLSSNSQGMELLKYELMPHEKYVTKTGSLGVGFPGILLFTTNSNFIITALYILMSVAYIVPIFVYFFVLLKVRYFIVILPFYVYSMTVHLKIFESGNIQLLTNYKYIMFYIVVLLLLMAAFVRKNELRTVY
jgi:hypothetical protein